jgi:DNA-binding response OmpR family regulator
MRILVVEDEPRIARFLANGLEAEGFVVDVSLTAEDGLSRLNKTETEFVILDLALPAWTASNSSSASSSRNPRSPS